ncbi:olfactory receptor 6B1-like [Ranitomeya variabilis]|uniref:olfactory receptor 6B1-like n=1 Tax=Ranitomeya variabilis TaxID=490064 RepID=UPI004056B8F1
MYAGSPATTFRPSILVNMGILKRYYKPFSITKSNFPFSITNRVHLEVDITWQQKAKDRVIAAMTSPEELTGLDRIPPALSGIANRNLIVQNFFHQILSDLLMFIIQTGIGWYTDFEKMFNNKSVFTEFIIVGFPGSPGLQYFFFFLLLITYLLTLLCNFLIMIITSTEKCLFTPMYFYIRNLSFLEVCYVSVIVPKILDTITIHGRFISFFSCISQLFFFFFLSSTECFLFGVMAYDRYIAICHPLHYAALMNSDKCRCLTIGSIIGGFVTTFPHIVLISQLPFCRSNVINHFFCDSPPLLQLACADTYLIDLLDFSCACLVILTSMLVTLLSYFHIIATIIIIPSKRGRSRAFSTCFTHLIVVSIYYSTVIFMYVKPKVTFSFTLNRVVAVFYTIITPILNPIIYCLRNKEVKESVRKRLHLINYPLFRAH